MERIVVTGMGLITALGDNPDLLWTALCRNEHAGKEYEDLKQEGFRMPSACRIAYFNNEQKERRGYSLSLAAISKAISHAGIRLPQDTALFLGTTIGESSAFERAATDPLTDLQQHTAGGWIEDLKKELQISGPSMALGTACAAGNYALGTAAAYMRQHNIKSCIAGGAEPFSRIAMTGFSRSRAMTSDYCRPFDKNRTGMMLGEGAAFFILEQEDHALRYSRQPLAVIAGLGLSSDAYHPTAPSPDGSGMAKAMYNAIKLSGLDPTDIDWVCSHGSGTLASDAAEAKAINSVFENYKVPVAGYKGALGHALGAATAIEAAICIASIQKQAVAPTVLCEESDLDLNIVKAPLDLQVRHILNCGYAFGGINSALVISKYLN